MKSAASFRTEFNKAARDAERGIPLYYGGVVPLIVHHDGVRYPNLDKKQGPQFGKPWLDGRYRDPKTGVIHEGDGVLLLKDRYTHDRALARDWAKKNPGKEPPQTILAMTALKVGEWIVSHYRDRGVTFLTGDPERDAAAKLESQRKARVFRKIECETIVSDFYKSRAKFDADPKNQGRTLTMTRSQVEAEMYLLSVERADTNEGRIECGAKGCGFWAERQEDVDLHRTIRHVGEQFDGSVQPGIGETENAPPPSATVATAINAKIARVKKGRGKYTRKPKVAPSAEVQSQP